MVEVEQELCLAGGEDIFVSVESGMCGDKTDAIRQTRTFPSAVGLTTTLINVYTAQHGYWSVTAIITIIIIALYFGATFTLTIIYKFGLSRR